MIEYLIVTVARWKKGIDKLWHCAVQSVANNKQTIGGLDPYHLTEVQIMAKKRKTNTYAAKIAENRQMYGIQRKFHGVPKGGNSDSVHFPKFGGNH